MMKKESSINGLDMQVLGGLVSNIKDQPEMAKASFSLISEWNGGFRVKSNSKSIKMGSNEVTRESISQIIHGFPTQFSGGNIGPTVCESCMASLGACMIQTIVLHASAMGIQIDGISINLEGDIDLRGFSGISDKVRPGAQQVRANVNIRSKKATPHQIKQLYEIGKKLSPAVDTITNGTSTIIVSST
jgi:uncharacterized OsmC-like protein